MLQQTEWQLLTRVLVLMPQLFLNTYSYSLLIPVSTSPLKQRGEMKAASRGKSFLKQNLFFSF